MALGILLALAATCSLALTVFFGKISVSKLSGQVITIFSQLGGAVLMPIFFLFFPLNLEISYISILIIVGLGLLDAIGFSQYFRALGREKASLVSAVVSANTFLSVLVGLVVFKEEITTGKVIALPILFISLAVMLLNPRDLRGKVMQWGSLVQCLIAAVCWGLYNPLLKVSGEYMDPVTPGVFARIITVLAMSLVLDRKEKEQVKQVMAGKARLLPLLAIAVCNVGIFLSSNLAVKHIDVSIASPIMSSSPVITAILMRIFLKEKISLRSWIGIVGVVISLVVLNWGF